MIGMMFLSWAKQLNYNITKEYYQMAFDMTQKAGGGKGKSKFVPENIVASAAPHYAVFSEYVELGTHAQATDQYPDKKPSQEACLGFELTDQTFVRNIDGEDKEIPLLLNRTVALSSHEKANCFKFFVAIGGCLSGDAIQKLIDAKVKPAAQMQTDKIGKGATSFLDLLGANCFLNVTHKQSVREFKDCYPAGTTKEAVEGGEVATVPSQKITWTWNNFTPASVSPTFHPKFGYEVCERPENSKGTRVFIFDQPTEESWKALDIWQKEKIKAALDYKGSSVEALVLSIKKDGDGESSGATTAAKAAESFPKDSNSMDSVPF